MEQFLQRSSWAKLSTHLRVVQVCMEGVGKTTTGGRLGHSSEYRLRQPSSRLVQSYYSPSCWPQYYNVACANQCHKVNRKSTDAGEVINVVERERERTLSRLRSPFHAADSGEAALAIFYGR